MNILTLKQARRTISLIASAGAKLDERIHQVGVSGLDHYRNNGDTTALTELVKAMPRSARGNALKYWCTKYANIRWDSKAFAKTGGFVKKSKSADIECHVEEAMANPFYNKEDKEPAKFNPQSRTKAFISAFSKALGNGEISTEDMAAAKAEIDAAFAA